MRRFSKVFHYHPMVQIGLLTIFSLTLVFLLGGCDQFTGYWLNVDTFGEGEIKIEPDRRNFERGMDEKVELKAIPAETAGYQFSHWEGDVPKHLRSERKIELFMDRHRDVEAVFINPHIEEIGIDEYGFSIEDPNISHKTIGERHDEREIYEIEGGTTLSGSSVQIYIWLPAEKTRNFEGTNTTYIWRGFSYAEDVSGDGIDLKYEFPEGTERFLAREESGEIKIKHFYHNEEENILVLAGKFNGKVHLYDSERGDFSENEEPLDISGSFSAIKE